MIHVEQKNILKKQGKKLGESNKWKQKSSKQATTQAKKQKSLEKNDCPFKKTKKLILLVCFIMILGGFLWILEKNKQNVDKFIV